MTELELSGGKHDRSDWSYAGESSTTDLIQHWFHSFFWAGIVANRQIPLHGRDCSKAAEDTANLRSTSTQHRPSKPVDLHWGSSTTTPSSRRWSPFSITTVSGFGYIFIFSETFGISESLLGYFGLFWVRISRGSQRGHSWALSEFLVNISVVFTFPSSGMRDRAYITDVPHGDKYIFHSMHFHWGSDSSRGSEHQIDSKRWVYNQTLLAG